MYENMAGNKGKHRPPAQTHHHQSQPPPATMPLSAVAPTPKPPAAPAAVTAQCNHHPPLHGCYRSFLLTQHPLHHRALATWHYLPNLSPPLSAVSSLHSPPSEHSPQQRQARYTHTPATLHSFLLPGGKSKSRTAASIPCYPPTTAPRRARISSLAGGGELLDPRCI